jgi:hypothetical protein
VVYFWITYVTIDTYIAQFHISLRTIYCPPALAAP